MSNRLKIVVVCILFVIGIVLLYYSISSTLYIADFVIDGDTIKVTAIRNFSPISPKRIIAIRYACVDTPEHDEPFFDEAYIKNKEMVVGNPIWFLVLDNDKYGRSVADVYVRRTKDVLWINETLLKQGLAIYYDVSGKCDKYPELLSAQKYAFDNMLGLWSLYYKYKDEKFIRAKGGYTFHLDTCNKIKLSKKQTIKRQRQFITLQEAVYIGLSPCRSCKPLLTLYLNGKKR